MSNLQESTIPIEWNIWSNFDVKDGQLIVTTSYSAGSPFGPDRNKGNLTSAVYDLNTRKQVYKQISTFKDNDYFGWHASYQAGKIWLHDLSDSKWIITDAFGKALITEQVTPLPDGARFIAYASIERRAYFLIYGNKEKAKLLAVEVTDAD